MANDILGSELNIDGLIEAADKAQKAMDKVADSAEGAGKRISDVFKSISTQGIDNTLQKLYDLKATYESISKVEVKDAGLKEIATNAKIALDEVNKLIEGLYKAYGAKTPTSTTAQQKAEENRYNEWLRQKHEEEQIHKQIEDRKTQSTRSAIAEQNQAYAEANAKKQSISRDNDNVKTNAEVARKAYEEQLRIYENLFAQAEKKRPDLIDVAKTRTDINAIDSQLDKLMDRINRLNNEMQLFKSMENGKTLKTEDYAHIGKVSDELNKLMAQYEALDKLKIAMSSKSGFEQAIADLSGVSLQAQRSKQALDDLAQSYRTGTSAFYQQMKTPEFALDFSKNSKSIEEERQAIQLLKQARESLDKTTPDGKKKVQELTDAIANHEKNLKRATQSTQEYSDAQRKLASQRLERIYSQSPNLAMNFSQSAKSINDQILAINRLKSARDNLNRGSFTSEDAYRKKVAELTNEIKRQQTEVDKLRGEQEGLGKSHHSLMNTADQLQRKLALLFSVSAIQGYINKLASVRAEFELQQRSLQIILSNKQQADVLWNKTVQLALKSPFRVKELTTYTKQLAAYRIETSKLFETTKMLADVSAGLGVDMQRLILAYGQIKAAGFLRGTEVRQLTEAGVSVYEELAKHFSAMEQTDVTVAEVIKRISNKQVTFADVEQIFKNITGEGGVFYKMQEQQAETLHGMISNLHDSVDLMLNDIGKSNDGVMKNMISLAKFFIDNWRVLATVLKNVALTMATIGVTKFVSGWRMVATEGAAAAMAMNGMAGAGARLNVAFKAIGKTIMAHPILAIVGALAAAGIAIYDYFSAIDEANAVYDENARNISEQTLKLRDYDDQVKQNNAAIAEHARLEKDSAASKEDVAAAQQKANEASASNSKILADLKRLYPDVYKGIMQQKDGTIEVNKVIAEQNKLLETQMLLQRRAKGDWKSDDLITNANEAAESLAEYDNALDDLKIQAADAAVEINEQFAEGLITEKQKNNALEFISAIKEASDFKDVLNIRFKYTKEEGGLTAINLVTKEIDNVRDAANKYQSTLNNLSSNLQKQQPIWRRTLKELLLDPVEGEEKARDFIKGQLYQFQIYDERIREWSFEEIVKYVGVELAYNTPSGETTDAASALTGWRKEIYDLCVALQRVTPDVKVPITPEDLLTASKPQVIALVTTWVNDIFSKAKAAAKAAAQPGQGVYDEKDKEQINQQINSSKDLYKYLGLTPSISSTFKKPKSKKTTQKTEDYRDDFANLLEDIYKDYTDLADDFKEEDAIEKVTEAWKDDFQEMVKKIKNLDFSWDDFDFTNIDGVITALEKVKKATKDADIALEIGNQISDLKVEKDIKEAEKRVELRDKEIDLLFEEYEIYKDIKELGISENWAKALFDINATSTKGLREELELRKDEFVGLKGEAKYNEFLEKITELEQKEYTERLRQYVEYAKKSVSERAKLKLEELTRLAEIEKATVGRGTEKDSDGHLQSVYDNATAKAIEERNAALQKLEWEEFQKSDTFIMMFEDLEFASEALMRNTLEQLENFRAEWADMPLEDVRAIIDKMNELKGGLMKLENPFKVVKKLKKELKGLKLSDLQTEAAGFETEIKKNDETISQLETIRTLRAGGKDLLPEQLSFLKAIGLAQNAELDAIDAEIGKRKDANNTAKQALEITLSQIKKFKDLKTNYEAQEALINTASDKAQELYDAFSELLKLFSDEDSIGFAFAEMGMSMVETVLQTLALQIQLKAARVDAEGFGLAMNKAMGVVGWIVMGVQVISQVLGAIFGAKDKKLQKEIDKLDEDVEKLSKALEKLEDALEKNYAFASLRSDMQKINGNIDQQIAKRRRQIELEKDKKETDKDQIKDWEDEIEELQEKRAELRKEMIESLGGVEDYRSATREFVDAWVDAFNETGNGLQGLTDNFREFFKNIILEQAVMKGAGKIMEPLLNEINKSLGDYEIQNYEEQKIKALSEQKMKELDEFLNGLFGDNGMWNEWIDDKGQSLSGLQEGIQGVTEETAQIIEAYLNSIRFYIAQDNQNLADLRNFFIGSEEDTNPILSQLKMQTELIRAIKDMFSSVIYSGGHPTYGGAFLKVSL